MVRTSFPELMTTREVAAVLRVDPRTIQRWAARGRLARVRLPTHTTRYRRCDVEALLEPTTSADRGA